MDKHTELFHGDINDLAVCGALLNALLVPGNRPGVDTLWHAGSKLLPHNPRLAVCFFEVKDFLEDHHPKGKHEESLPERVSPGNRHPIKKRRLDKVSDLDILLVFTGGFDEPLGTSHGKLCGKEHTFDRAVAFPHLIVDRNALSPYEFGIVFLVDNPLIDPGAAVAHLRGAGAFRWLIVLRGLGHIRIVVSTVLR